MKRERFVAIIDALAGPTASASPIDALAVVVVVVVVENVATNGFYSYQRYASNFNNHIIGFY
jgi:hypothetical protein